MHPRKLILTSLISMMTMLGGQLALAEAAPVEKESLPIEDLQTFAEVFGKIKSGYVDGATDEELLRNAIEGMLSGLDPHSAFLAPEAYEDIVISTEGKFGGLGIEVTLEEGQVKVVSPIDGTPAYDADIQPGDIILEIDGNSIQGLELGKAVEGMRGEPGTRVVLTIARENEPEVIEVPIVRAIIEVASVRSELLDEGFGYVRVSVFQGGTANSLEAQIEQLTEDNDSPLRGLVLDLRNNPGGVLGGAIDVSDLFLEQGVIVATRGRNKSSDSKYQATKGDILADAPLVVLVNGGSASASEIVVGALQDHRRAIIMGTKTFGKGSVQSVIPMNNGGALKLTTARYYTPLDRSIQAKGITPDIVITQTKFAEDSETNTSLREADLDGHLENNDDEENVSSQQRSQLLDEDFQVREAFNMLKGMNLAQSRQNKTS